MAPDAPIERTASLPEQIQGGLAAERFGREALATGELPRMRFTRRQLLATSAFVGLAIVFLYFGLPRIVGLQETWNRIRQGNVWWLGLGVALELCSFGCYVAVFRVVFVREDGRIGWRESYQITMAGLAATRVFAAAGAGGIALTAWALRRSGLTARVVASRMVAFLALLYGVYMGTLVVCGLGLYTGLFGGPAPFAITVVPALFGALVIALFLGIALFSRDTERLVGRWTAIRGRLGVVARRIAAIPATAGTGVRTALALLRTRDPQLLGAAGWWAFDIAVLWACFHAFGAAPPQAVIVMGYFVGMLGNTLPLPGGIGGVDGGMIGAFSAFGVPVDISIVSVLAYRALAFWLPTLPGALAYLQLRRTVSHWQHAQTPTLAARTTP